MGWKCYNCKKVVKEPHTVKCPYCGYRILYKERPSVVRKVKAE